MRCEWLTRNPYMRSREAAILAALDIEGSCLEVGCGEGNNLEILGLEATGIDISRASLKTAHARLKGRFSQADAARLPFRDGSFDRVFSRDVLHHVDDSAAVVAEMVRVCRPGGKVCVLDDNGRNTILRLFSTFDPTEKKIRTQTVQSLAALFRGLPVGPVSVSVREPTLLYRALLHHKFGLPALGRSRFFARAMDRYIASLEKSADPDTWAYVSIIARKS